MSWKSEGIYFCYSIYFSAEHVQMNLVMQFFGNINPNIFLDSDSPPPPKKKKKKGGGKGGS